MIEETRGTVQRDQEGAGDDASSAKMVRRVLASSAIGAVIEWYDFYLFSVASAVVFNVQFFPRYSPTAGVLASFATLAVGFIARPLGGVIWGHFGDRIGRKKMLVLTVLLMGAATTGVGLLPGYAQIGIWAPLLLVVLRIVQGLSGGGEWGGAVLMAMEHAPRRRGLASSVPQMGVFGGILLANGVFALVTTMPQDAFLSWGWRVPFLASVTLVAVGLWIRLGVAESPVFARERAAEARGGHRIPLFDILRHPKNLIVALMLVVGPFASAAIYGTFAVSYAVQLGYSRHVALDTVVVSNTIGLLAQPGFAWLSDRVGRRPVVLAGVLLQAVGIFVMFALINTRDMGLLYLGLGIFSFAHGVTYSPLAAWLGELFATRARYTGASLGYQLAGTIGGGFTPLIAASLLAASGGAPHSLPVSLYMLALFAITATGAFLARETHKVKL